MGPLPPSHGQLYLLTCIDRFSRWPEFFPMPDMTADTVALTFTSGWIACFGVPSTVTTDCGRQFESQLWSKLLKLLGCKHLRTTAYHPAANGMIEHFHQQLKSALKAQESTQHWIENLPLVLLGIRTALKTDLQCFAAELVYGRTLRLPGEFFHQDTSAVVDSSTFLTTLKNTMRNLRAVPPQETSQPYTYVHKDLSTCTHVFIRTDAVRKPLQPPYEGPFKVLKRDTKYFTVELNGRTDNIALDRLKPAHVDILLQPQPFPSPPTTPCPTLTDMAPTRTTRSGRRVHFPDHLMGFIPMSLGGGGVM